MAEAQQQVAAGSGAAAVKAAKPALATAKTKPFLTEAKTKQFLLQPAKEPYGVVPDAELAKPFDLVIVGVQTHDCQFHNRTTWTAATVLASSQVGTMQGGQGGRRRRDGRAWTWEAGRDGKNAAGNGQRAVAVVRRLHHPA